MITEIGITAGEIWHALDQTGKTISLSQLRKSIDKPSDIILMSLGWLSREGHVIVSKDENDYSITLRKEWK